MLVVDVELEQGVRADLPVEGGGDELAFAVGAAFGTFAERRRDRVVGFFTRNPALWAFFLALVAPAALAPDWAVDASQILVFAMLPLGFFVVGGLLLTRIDVEEGRAAARAANGRARQG